MSEGTEPSEGREHVVITVRVAQPHPTITVEITSSDPGGVPGGQAVFRSVDDRTDFSDKIKRTA
jgi:hypothetical protein